MLMTVDGMCTVKKSSITNASAGAGGGAAAAVDLAVTTGACEASVDDAVLIDDGWQSHITIKNALNTR